MSSMRNAVQRRNHKERAQPIEREKWGLLEKRKDYKLRAADHKSKQKRLKLLREKASERNPDEFSFKMINSQVDKAGRKVADRGNKTLSVDVVKLLKTQDAGYIRTMLQMVRKERQELEQRIILETEGEVKTLRDGYEDDEKAGKTVFVKDREEQIGFDEDAWFGEGRELPGRKEQATHELYEDDEEDLPKKKLSKKQQEAKLLAAKEEQKMLRNRDRTQERMVIRLDAVKARERDLMIAEEELENQRAKMAHTTGGVNKQGVKFKIRERKR